MKRLSPLLFSVGLFLLACGGASADSLVVQTCGVLPQAYLPGATRLETVDVNGNRCQGAPGAGAAGTAGYPQGAIPVQAAGIGTTAAVGATLPGVAGKTTFLCGFTIGSQATAATSGNAQIVNALSANPSLLQAVAVAPAVATMSQTFAPCIPATGLNTGIAVNAIAAGAGGNTTVYTWGYQA